MWWWLGCTAVGTIPDETVDDSSVIEESPSETAETSESNDSGDSEFPDTEPADTAVDTAEPLPFECSHGEGTHACPFESVEIEVASDLSVRTVYYQLPNGTPPASGWPVVFLFQGSYRPALGFFESSDAEPFNEAVQVLLTERLLSEGFAVIAPETRFNGLYFWDTNVAPYNEAWSLAPDADLIEELFARVEDGGFGALDPSLFFAAGLSSGGYLSSRMAVSYPDQFTAIAVQSAGYASCAGAWCPVELEIPENHPPALLLHGTEDAIAPVQQAEAYADALAEAGIAWAWVEDPELGHAWLWDAPDQIVPWFLAQLPDE